MSISAALAFNCGWTMETIKETPVCVLFLFWRQLAYQTENNIGWTLEDLDLIETIELKD